MTLIAEVFVGDFVTCSTHPQVFAISRIISVAFALEVVVQHSTEVTTQYSIVQLQVHSS